MTLPPTSPELYNPPDIAAAQAQWGANCGPAALAALLAVHVNDLHGLFPNFQGDTNPSTMEAALTGSGRNWRRVPQLPSGSLGLCWLQVDGPWTRAKARAQAADQHTHWIGIYAGHAGQVFDVNAGHWLPIDRWRHLVMARCIDQTPRATGWRIRTHYKLQTR